MNFVLKGIEDYSAYESCLMLGMDVNTYAMEAFDFGKLKETISRKFNEVKTWVIERWNDIVALLTKISNIITGKLVGSKYLQGKALTKEERAESAKSRRYYQALARSEDVIKEGAEKFVEDMKVAALGNKDPEARKNAEDYTIAAYRNAGRTGNLKDISDKFKDLENYIASDGTQYVAMKEMSRMFAENVIKEGKRMLKVGDVLMKGPIKQLFAAITGTLKVKDVADNGAGKAFQIAVQALNFIGKSAKFIFNVITLQVRPLFRALKSNREWGKDFENLKRIGSEQIPMNITPNAHKMTHENIRVAERQERLLNDDDAIYMKLDEL